MMKCDWGDHHSPNIRSFAMASDRLIDFVYMYIIHVIEELLV